MRPILLVSLALLARNLPAQAERSGTSFDLAALHELIVPTPQESAWQRIPWMVDLIAAREKGTRQGRPIFLWEMDGHPLGCT